LALPLAQTGEFPPLLIQVIAMGEQTGRLDELLLQTADAYEKETSAAIARVMTYIPLYTPFAMMNRAGGPPDVWEYLASSAVILVTLWLFFRGAAKVFRIGVLMTGKPPRIGEILRWMRAPVK